MTQHVLMSGPFAHDSSSVQRIMRLVLLALLPATLFNLYLFGWPAINLFAVTIVSAILAEATCLLIARRPVARFLGDGSAVLTGWLLAMTLPPWAPWWIGVVGAVLAVVVGKHIFGGLGQNLFNPAMVARAALLISFPLQMTAFVTVAPLGAAGSPDFWEGLNITFGAGSSFDVDAFSSATILEKIHTQQSIGIPVTETVADSFSAAGQLFGIGAGSIGETSFLLLCLGGLFLIYKRVIHWEIPASLLASLAALSTLFYWLDPQQFAGPQVHLLAGGTALAAFFIATDLVTSPATRKGQIIFGVGCGVLIFVIRAWADYPEGIAFAILLMNALTPLIDRHCRPRAYGRTAKGHPISME
jgi:Na+-translocating ferredoxin:NAD+ oxidoreductase subunit D